MEICSKLTGVTYFNKWPNSESRQLVIFQLLNNGLLQPGQELIFQHDKNNPFDHNAIAVYGPDMRQIGFLPSDMAATVCQFIQAGFRISIVVGNVTGGINGNYFGVNVKIIVHNTPIAPPLFAACNAPHEHRFGYNYEDQDFQNDWNPHGLDEMDYENWLDDLND